jgi:molybdopterin-guanine dinucleotide biosynthesis protein A
MSAGIAGAVLAGGRSRRMGWDKALVEVDGRPMARSVLDALAAAGVGPLFVVGGDEQRLSVLDVTVVADLFPGEGPLGGVLTALHHVGRAADHVLVAACDLPDLDATVLDPLLAAARRPPPVDPPRAVVPRAGRLHPACAVWAASAAEPLRTAYDAGERSLHGALVRVRVELVDVPAEPLRNINTPDELAR